MKKSCGIFLSAVLILSLFAGCGTEKEPSASDTNDNQTQIEKLSVYASFYPMYDFALKIGGNKADVVNMIPAGTEPHDWEPTAADIAGLEEADIFIFNGAGIEHWAEDVLESLQNKDLIAVEASKNISLMEDQHEDESEEFDPHVWLSPLNAKKEMENIKKVFTQADPDNKDYYEANYNKYAAEFDALDEEYKDTLNAVPNKDVIVAHQAFGYLCSAYDLNQVPIEGLAPDSEPDPARVSEIIEFAKEHKVKVIFFEDLVSPKVSETIADAINAKTDVLNPIEGLSSEQLKAGDDYFSSMRQNLQSLKAALE
jgi:zinc transport system substrate-binding protein